MTRLFLAVPIILAAGIMFAPPTRNQGQQPPLPESPITGRVVLSDGKPAAQAQVFLVGGASPGAILAEGTTDDDGAFKLEHRVEHKRGELMPTLAAFAGRSGMGFRFLAGWKNGEVLRLQPAVELKVRFRSPDGGAAKGVRVAPIVLVESEPLEIDPESAPRGTPLPERRMRAFLVLPPDLAERVAATTDGQGTALFEGLPAGMTTRIQPLDERFGELGIESQIELAERGRTEAGPLALKLAAVLSGRVLDAQGKPVEGVRVGAQGAGPHHGWGDGRTGRDGSFRIGRLAAGEYNVALDLQGELADNWTAVAFEKLAVEAGKTKSGLVFRLVKGGRIVGRVLDASGKPVQGMHVGVYGPAHPRSGAWVQHCLTDEDGRYRLRVPPGSQHVYLMGGPVTGEAPPNNGRDVEVAEGNDTTVDFRLP